MEKKKDFWKERIKELPFSPGVYFFKDEKAKILYIGKAGSLRDRVSSYFQEKNELVRPIEWVLNKVVSIDFQTTDSVLEAYFLEQELIKKYQPTYNVLGKDDKSFCFIVLTQEKFPRILIVRKTDLEKFPEKNGVKIQKNKIFGPYASRKILEEALKILRKIFPFHSIQQQDEKKCFDFQIGLCPGPYANKISQKDYQKNIQGIVWILKGKKKTLLSKMKKEMQTLADRRDFEGAVLLRNQIIVLEKIRDIVLLKNEKEEDFLKINKKEKAFRIEGFDISSLSGGLFVGSMVVFSNKEGFFQPEKSQYRKFKIKKIKTNSDLLAMQEVLERRLKRSDWPMPDLILLDGGQTHLNLAKKVLDELNLKIPCLAVAKGPTRKKMDLFYLGIVPKIELETIRQIRDEAHRFAITYHRKVRKKEFLGY